MSIRLFNLLRNNKFKYLRISLAAGLAALISALFIVPLFSQSSKEEATQNFLQAIHWHGHASFRIELSGKIIYIDPWNLQNAPQADYILITNSHFGHFSKKDINTLRTAKTTIITVKSVAAKIDEGNLKIIELGKRLRFGTLVFEAVPAYTVDNNSFPQGKGYAGYIISNSKIRIYHAGSTGIIPEMENIQCDIALLPVSGGSVMGPEEAADVVRIIQPDIAIPMHYGTIVGSVRDAHAFKDLAATRVKVLNAE